MLVSVAEVRELIVMPVVDVDDASGTTFNEINDTVELAEVVVTVPVMIVPEAADVAAVLL
jgi:hypothetical protein